jgi:hypothetical protein
VKRKEQFMTKMTPFRYVEFYDVPRCIVLRYAERLFLLQSAFDQGLDDYPTSYSIYVLPKSVEDSLRKDSWEFLSDTPMSCIGQIQIDKVEFDPSRRKELDASFLDSLIADQKTD